MIPRSMARPAGALVAALLCVASPAFPFEGGKEEAPKATPYKEQFKDEIRVKGARGPVKDAEITYDGYDRLEWKAKSGAAQKKDRAEIESVKYGDQPTPFTKGMDAFRAGRWADAETEFRGVRSAIDAGKARKFWEGRALAFLGECRRRGGAKNPAKLKEAVPAYEDSIKGDAKGPFIDVAYLGLAECHAASAEWDSALKVLDDFRKVAVEAQRPAWEGRSRLLRGRFLERKGEVGGAAAEYQDLAKFAEAAASKAAPGSPERHELDGLKASGQVSSAWALFGRAEKSKSPADLDASKKAFDALSMGGSHIGAAAAANGLGALLLLEGKAQKALEKFVEVEVTRFQAPDEVARALWYKAKAYDALGNQPGREQAVKDLAEFYPSSEWAVRVR